MKFSLQSILGLSLAHSVLSQGTDLGGGIITRTNVDYLADLALDIRDMTAVHNSEGGVSAAMAIYLDGKNSEPTIGERFKLTQLSTSLATRGVETATPQFLFHLYGLSERDVSKLAENLNYADVYVRALVTAGDVYAPTAAVYLNVWMYATHVLFDGLDTCQKLMEADNPSQFNLGTAGFDEMIALWIGAGQSPGSDNGYSLYAEAQESYNLFGGALDEAPTNTKIKSLYQEASSLLSVNGVCTDANDESPRKLWSIVTQVISQMQVPVIQQLIDAVLAEDSQRTEFLAYALVPQVSQCRPSVYKRLRDYLLSENPRFDKKAQILRDLQDVYSCFGLTCDDIGVPDETYGVTLPACIAADARAPLALYRPSTDVNSIARIDLDVLQLRILTSLGSFSFAKFWYLYGRNSPVQRDSENDPFAYYSLADLAVATSRRNADPLYTEFIHYHSNNNYADKIIRDTLEGTGKWGTSASVAQRSAVITETSSFMVLFLHLIAQINDAVKTCNGISEGGEYDLTHPWDEVAALTVGSLEGTEEGGSVDVHDGQLIFSLNTRRGFQFQKLNSKGYSKLNSVLEDLLYAGKGEIDATECATFQSTAERIKSLALVPLMQSVLRYAVTSQSLQAGTDSAEVALGETFALAIIPIMEYHDANSASIVEENMIYRPEVKPVRDGAQAVADAIGDFAVASGLQCSLLGSTPEADPCRYHGGSSSSTMPSVVLSTLASAMLSLLFFL